MFEDNENKNEQINDNSKNELQNVNQDKLNLIKEELTEKQEKWNNIIFNLTKKLKDELKYMTEFSAELLYYRQLLIEERTKLYYFLYQEIPKIKKLYKKYFEWYSVKYPIKINASQKEKLIESDMSYFNYRLEYYQNYINFLSDSIKTIDNLIYSVKNKIDLYNITGME